MPNYTFCPYFFFPVLSRGLKVICQAPWIIQVLTGTDPLYNRTKTCFNSRWIRQKAGAPHYFLKSSVGYFFPSFQELLTPPLSIHDFSSQILLQFENSTCLWRLFLPTQSFRFRYTLISQTMESGKCRSSLGVLEIKVIDLWCIVQSFSLSFKQLL